MLAALDLVASPGNGLAAEGIADSDEGFIGEDDLGSDLLVQRFEAGRDVHCVTDDGVIHAMGGADVQAMTGPVWTPERMRRSISPCPCHRFGSTANNFNPNDRLLAGEGINCAFHV